MGAGAKREQEGGAVQEEVRDASLPEALWSLANRLARQDKIAPTIGREMEIQQIIEILCHRERANSPMLVGEPGLARLQ